MHADKMEVINNQSATIGEGTSFHCHHGDEVFKMEITDWQNNSYVSLKHKLPFGLFMRETTEFIKKGLEVNIIKVKKPKIIIC